MVSLPTIRPALATLDTRTVLPMQKQADAHYSSPEHKAWRKAAMVRAGWKCQAPGCTKRAPKDRLYADHIVELRDGGDPLDPANSQVLCSSHHTSKTLDQRAKRHGLR